MGISGVRNGRIRQFGRFLPADCLDFVTSYAKRGKIA